MKQIITEQLERFKTGDFSGYESADDTIASQEEANSDACRLLSAENPDPMDESWNDRRREWKILTDVVVDNLNSEKS